jgi:endo-1,4-beta-xylanase
MKIFRNIVIFLFFAGINLAFFACGPNETTVSVAGSGGNTTPTVTGVTVSPSTASVAKGYTQQFNASVAGTNSPAQTVTWDVIGGGSGTSIATNGTLTVAAGETVSSLTVKATSTVDTSKSGTATVTVTAQPALSGTVSISGIKEVNQSLTVITTGLNGNGTTTYQWTSSDALNGTFTNISSATSSTYKLVTADLNKYIKVTVSRNGSTGNVTSDAVGPVRVALVIPTTPLDSNAAGVQTFTSNSGGNQALTGSSYGYEMWTEGGNDNKLIWFGPNQGGGAAFRAEWKNPDDFLGRVGYFWGNGGLFTQYKNIYADFNYTRSGRSTAGNYSYIGIYGWARNPSAAKEEEKLIEYYIVEDWFGNQWQDDTSPMGTGTTGGSEVGSFTLDGATYKVIKNKRVNKPSIDGEKTFTQFFSIRQSLRKTGTISVTEHFKKWDELGMKLGNMYECKFLVEAGGGTGWLEFTYLKFSQEDIPR